MKFSTNFRRSIDGLTQWEHNGRSDFILDPVSHFLASVNELFDYVLQNVRNGDMVGITVHEVNQSNKPIGISFRQKDLLSGDVIWSVFEKVAQSILRFNTLDILTIVVHSVRMPIVSEMGLRVKADLSIMAHLKRSIIEVKAENKCLAHALIIAILRVNNDPNYISYRDGWKIRPVVQTLLKMVGIDLTNGAGIPELTKFQEHFHEYKFIVYAGLNCESILFEGQAVI